MALRCYCHSNYTHVLFYVQTYYDTTPRLVVQKLAKALLARLTWGDAHASLQDYLTHLQQHHPNALLLQHPLPEEEREFWQQVVNEGRQRLEGLLPVTQHRLETEPLGYLPFLWHALTVLEAPIEGEVDPRELQRRFNLLPQTSNRAPFIQVTAQNSNHRAMLIISTSCELQMKGDFIANVCAAAAKSKQVKAISPFGSVILGENANQHTMLIVKELFGRPDRVCCSCCS